MAEVFHRLSGVSIDTMDRGQVTMTAHKNKAGIINDLRATRKEEGSW